MVGRRWTEERRRADLKSVCFARHLCRHPTQCPFSDSAPEPHHQQVRFISMALPALSQRRQLLPLQHSHGTSAPAPVPNLFFQKHTRPSHVVKLGLSLARTSNNLRDYHNTQVPKPAHQDCPSFLVIVKGWSLFLLSPFPKLSGVLASQDLIL